MSKKYKPVLQDLVETLKGERTLGTVVRIQDENTVLVQWEVNHKPVPEHVTALTLIFHMKPGYKMAWCKHK